MNKKTLRTVLLYLLCYSLLAGLLLYFFRDSSRSLVYQGDGWRQHLRALTYYGKYLRGCIRHLLIDHSLKPQTLGLDFGYGADVITTLQYYCLGDPLAALSVLVPSAYTLALYEALIFLRPLLAGLAFILYAHVRGERRTAPVLTGALTYAFSGTVLYIGMLHPYFVNPMIYFPLLLAGIEHVLQRPEADTLCAGHRAIPEAGNSNTGKPLHLADRIHGIAATMRPYLPFAISVAIAALCNFYFFYMLAIFTFAYGIARIAQKYGKTCVNAGIFLRTLSLEVLRFLAAAATGVLCAGVTLVPVLVQFKDDPRAAVGRTDALLYNTDYYAQLPVNLVSFLNHPQLDTELCFSLPFVFLALVLFLRRGHRTLKLCMGLTLLLLLFPAAAVALNGFSYPINRWTWAAAMLAGWVCVRGLGVILETRLCLRRADRIESGQSAPGLTLVGCFFAAAVPVLTILSIVWNIFTGYAPDRGAFPEEFKPQMDAAAYTEAAADNEVRDIAASIPDEHGFVRYSGRNLNWNAALASGLSSTQFEFSLANGTVSDFLQLIGVNDEQNFAYLALEDRMPALSLAGVSRYSLAYDNYYEYRFVPWGFEDLGLIGTHRIYENPQALPLGFTLPRVISRKDLETLPLPVREEVLLSAAAVEDIDLDKLMSANMSEKPDSSFSTSSDGTGPLSLLTAEQTEAFTASYDTPFSIHCENGASFTEGNADVSPHNDADATSGISAGILTFPDNEASAILVLDEPIPAGCEFYVCLEGLTVDAEEDLCPLTFEARLDGEEWLTRTINYKLPSSQYYSDWHDFALCFGSAGEGVQEIRVSAATACSCRFDRLYAMLRPMEDCTRMLETAKAEALTGADLYQNPISFATNTITGRIEVSAPSLFILQIPYSRGFSARVDGTDTPIIKVDAMFLGIPLDAGVHDVMLTYRTPGLCAGILCSLLGLILLLSCAVFSRTRRSA